MTPAQFGQMMKQQGLNVDTLKARIHADFVWQQIVRGKFQGSLQVGDKEVDVKLQAANKMDTTGFEYTLRPILLLVPRGSAPAAFEARKREAESLRARFQSCSEGLRFAMALPDVAMREPITRVSTDLGQAQRDVLNNTPVGRLTPPDVTLQGVELFAVCNKTEAKGGETAAKREARESVFNERFQALSKKYPQGTAQPGADRDPIDDDATARADARRAGRDRPGHHACRLAKRATNSNCLRSMCWPTPNFSRVVRNTSD